jgi:hypothetical protein
MYAFHRSACLTFLASQSMATGRLFNILLGVGFFFLLILLAGLHFEPLHDILKMHPLCRSDHLKLKTELPFSAPPDDRGLNLNWGIVLYRHDPEFQRGAWLNVGRTFDSTTSEGEIDEAAFSPDHGDG